MTIKKFSTPSRLVAIFCLTALTATIFFVDRLVTAQETQKESQIGGDLKTDALFDPNPEKIVVNQVSEEPGLNAWTAAAAYPIPILDEGVTAFGGNLYAFGGNSSTPTAAANKFDGTTWTAIAPLPEARAAPAVTNNGTNVYIIGGANPTGTLASTLRYDVTANTYTEVAPSPTATAGSGSAFLNGKIYKVGGTVTVGMNNMNSAALDIYDVATNTWTSGAPYPNPNRLMSVFALGNFIYAVGGQEPATSLKTRRYDPATNTWDDAAIADLPATRYGSVVGVSGNFAVVAGGYAPDSNALATTNVSAWDSINNTWRELTPLSQPRTRMSGAVLNGTFYVIGGSGNPFSFAGTNNNQALNLTQSNISGTVTYVSENGTPANNSPDPGETVTVSLSLQNTGLVNSGSSVTATLQNSGGVIPVAPASQNYGTLTAGAASTSRPFTFTVPAGASCASTITLTFNVTDGANSSTVTQTYTLGAANPGTSFSSTGGAITINDGTFAAPAAASPYPATINVTGITGATQLVRVGINGMSHAFPADVEIILVNPAGTAMLIMSDVGGGTDLVNTNFVIDDAAAAQFTTAAIVSGSFKPTNLEPANDVVFPAPAPTTAANPGPGGTPAGTATLNGTFGSGPFNGTWQVFIVDDAPADTGSIQSVSLNFAATPLVCSAVAPTNARADFDGDGRTDLSVFRNGTWFAQRSTAGFAGVSWGTTGDVLLPGDYDGDNKTDFAIYRQAGAGSATDFYVLNSIGNTVTGAAWGDAGDIPKNGDFTGDNRDDLAVYRPSTNTFFVLPLGAGAPASYTRTFGAAGGQPYVLFYDNDLTADLATRNGADWYVNRTTPNTTQFVNWGIASDRAVSADYDNDNRDDIAVFRNGQWFVLPSNGGAPITYTFGAAGDIPAPGDYDGDGDDEPAVFRNGTWFVNTTGSSFNSVQFGVTGDRPIPTAYVQQ